MSELKLKKYVGSIKSGHQRLSALPIEGSFQYAGGGQTNVCPPPVANQIAWAATAYSEAAFSVFQPSTKAFLTPSHLLLSAA